MSAMAAIENLFFASPESEGLFTLNLVGSIGVTCRSKIAKLIPIGNPRWPPSCFIYTYIPLKIFLSETRRPLPLIFGYLASSSSHAYSTIRHPAIMFLSSNPQPVIRKHSFSTNFKNT